jgi:hypothetical protein
MSNVCPGRDNDMEYWRDYCRCSLDSSQPCPPCPEEEDFQQATNFRSDHSNETKSLILNPISQRSTAITIHTHTATRSANLVIHKGAVELELHNKSVRHVLHNNSTNFIRFG